MRILEELKLELIQIITDTQKKSLHPSDRFLQFIREGSSCMADAETAADLARSMKNLVKLHLSSRWINPLRFFSMEYQLHEKLISVLNREDYSLINLLVRTCNEDRQMIRQLEQEKAARDVLLSARGATQRVIAHYEQQLRAHADADEMNKTRISELTAASDHLIEEKEALAELSEKQTGILSILGKLSNEAGFLSFIQHSSLSAAEKECLAGYFNLTRGSEEHRSTASLSL